MSLKLTYQKYRTYYNIIRKDLRDKFPLPFYKKIGLWRKGFLAEKYTLYELDKNNYKDYFSDFHASMARNVNEPFNDVLTNKLIFSEVVGNVLKVPKTYGWIFNGIYYSKDSTTLSQVVNSMDRLVVKAVTGGGGKGVYIISKERADTFVINNERKVSQVELFKFIETLDNFIVTEFINPGSFSKSLNEDTVNTMRVITLLEPETNKPFIARAVQRIGVSASAPMDNFTKGGLSASIDLETGVLSDATSHPKDIRHIRFTKHPETNVKFEGKQIPNWEKVKEEILQGVAKLPMLKCVGWDFILSDKGLVAIEGNHHPDPDVLQGHSPILTDQKIKDFYKYHKII